jgi:hypothetical protein
LRGLLLTKISEFVLADPEIDKEWYDSGLRKWLPPDPLSDEEEITWH